VPSSSAPQIAQGELDHGASGSEYQRSGAFLLNSICGYAVGYCIVSDDICSGLRNAKQIIYCEEAPPLCCMEGAPYSASATLAATVGRITLVTSIG
jgi:hypothetical protein